MVEKNILQKLMIDYLNYAHFHKGPHLSVSRYHLKQ